MKRKQVVRAADATKVIKIDSFFCKSTSYASANQTSPDVQPMSVRPAHDEEVAVSSIIDDSFDYKSILKDLSSAIKSSDTLQIARLCATVPPLISPQLLKLASSTSRIQDPYANSLLSRICPAIYAERFAAKVSGNGDCLFNSASLLTAGTEVFAEDLRVRTCVQLLQRRQEYLQHSVAKNFHLLSPDYDEAIRDCAKGYTDVCMWAMMGLSSVLQREIVSVYPKITHMDAIELGHAVANVTLIPLTASLAVDSSPLFIMWTRVRNDGVAPWTPNHFCPLFHRTQQSSQPASASAQPASASQPTRSSSQPISTSSQPVVDSQPASASQPTRSSSQPVSTSSQLVVDSQPASASQPTKSSSQPVNSSSQPVVDSQRASASQPVSTSSQLVVDSQPASASSHWPDVWNEDQWLCFKRKYIWLDCRSGHLGCLYCIEAKNLGSLREERLSLSEEWCTYSTGIGSSQKASREMRLTALRVRIKKHYESRAHSLATTIAQSAKAKCIESSLAQSNALHDQETESVMRTAYYPATNNRPFTDHENLIELQKLNGVSMGLILHSRYTATNIVTHIAAEMRRKIVTNLVISSSKLSVVIYESTTVGKQAVLVVHIRAVIDNKEPVFIFLDLIELEAQTAAAIVLALEKCLQSAGFTKEYLNENWIAIVSDCASVMLGRKSGVVTQLSAKYPRLFTWHCLNHRLELAVHDAVKEITAINHFKAFIDSIYSLYSQSSKNQRELREVSLELEAQILRIGRVLDTRWVASSFRTVKAIWVSHAVLASHFKHAADDTSRDSVERKKFNGLLARLVSVQFIRDLGLMYDALSELSHLSLDLQLRSMTLSRAQVMIVRTIRVLQSFKESPGEKFAEALKAGELLMLNDVALMENRKVKSIHAGQFLQSLCNNLNARMSNDAAAESQFLQDIDILDPSKWPRSPSIRHGETEVRRLCRRWNIDTEQAIRGMREYVEDHSVEPEDLRPMALCIRSIPCSSSECERAFSVMNNIQTDVRNSLLIATVGSIMFIKINGPPLALFDCKPYVKSWKLNHRAATDTRSRQCKVPTYDSNLHALWKICNSSSTL